MECNDNNLAKFPNEIKQIIHAEEIDNSEKVMACINTISSTSNTLKNLVVNKSFHSSYIQIEFNDKKKIIINIFVAYVVPLLKDINHSALFQEWKLNIDAELYEINIDANMSKPSDKKEIDCHDSDLYWPTKIKYTIQWFPLLSIMEHTENILNPKQGIITSLLKLFSILSCV